MKTLIKQAVINDPRSSLHNCVKDILIVNGIIESIADHIPNNDYRVIEASGLLVSPGWMDVFAHFCDPGGEHRENLESGAKAAAAGGFTTAMVVPNTKPVVDNKVTVQYIVQKNSSLAAQVIPIGAITHQAEGKELAEMYDMYDGGAVAFSDGLNPVQSQGLLLKALQYVKAFNGVIIQLPDDKSIAPYGLMHEGVVSTRLGLPGKPIMAEEIVVSANIELAKYTDSRIHFTAVTSPKALAYIKQAKAEGIQVTCSVTPYHLYFCDEDLMQYDANLKVNPPLRTRENMMALRAAVADGTVDCIATHHIPQDFDAKTQEFEYAKNGMIGLESCYSVLKTVLPDVEEKRWAELLSINPRNIFGQSVAIENGQPAHLTIYNPQATYIFDREHIFSACNNTPFIGKELKGKVVATVYGNQVSIS